MDSEKVDGLMEYDAEFVGSGPLRCLLLDEAHFLTKRQVSQLVLITKKLGLAVLCYGLRSDFLGEPFEGSKYLLCWAEEMVEIKTICHCGSKATMNVRLVEKFEKGLGTLVPVRIEDGGDQVCIGGNDRYISCCMRHFDEAVGSVTTGANQLE